MKPAELKMELLIPLSLLSSFFFPMSLFSSLLFPLYCSQFLFLWHNISEFLPHSPLSRPSPSSSSSSVCCGCCAVAPTKIEIKNLKNKLNFPKLGKQGDDELVKRSAPDFFRTKKPRHGEREKRR